MPRPTRPRTSLPSHQRAAKPIPHAQDDAPMLDAPEASSSRLDSPDPEEDAEPARPPTKQTKADKLKNRREALLARITGDVTPYSKSHARRAKRAARPSEHLVTSLAAVEDVLPVVDDFEVGGGTEKGGEAGGKKGTKAAAGSAKLTERKRQKVLTDEAARLPAVMSNPAFKSDPFATIRLHTLNTLATVKHDKAKPAKKTK